MAIDLIEGELWLAFFVCVMCFDSVMTQWFVSFLIMTFIRHLTTLALLQSS